ncbi:helix-turn-helix transcriptional regulator [Flavobacterium sp. Fl-77]|uniref:Helix-turn-helix transcriptional regulator n=1 Tax=Flavobacterium flavipigmentatum TaxID=2893884 RepID=A0AAJ2SBZ7_9FLAO|nr:MULTISPECIES: helix-turn-helix transcriptional regulator [unclassified Flavobacterium]MDX6182881.1 helix-turn-helix transcriptional regulator [Flavobacterium sp. Fl-33]MDX6186334.1 helix-turn-helix transcriptional regulator [Flavobacterium sp. Fl-77]UFH37877.1 helix-turn-helix domain-containing protein [Flavobacterium sp. F-70]
MNTSIGNNIKSIRELKNYTQEYMADCLGITQAGYSKIESGKNNISYKKIEKIAVVLEVNLEDIVYFEGQRYFKNVKENDVGDFMATCSKVEKLYEDKVFLLEKLLCKTDLELKRYKEKFGVI